MPVKPARNNNFFLTASRWSIKVLRNLTQQCQNSLGQNIMHQNHHNYINRMQSNDDDYSARLKKHRLCISLFQAFQKGLNPQVSKATTPSQEEEKPSGCPFQTDLPTYPGIGFSSPFHQNQGAAVPWKSKGQIAAADTPNPTSTIHHTLSLRLLGRLLQPRVAPGSAVFNPWPLPNQLGERINHC